MIFAWYVVSLCLYDTFGTLFDVNVVSLYPEKFTGLNERRTVQAMGTILGIVGLVLAAIIPPMFITTGVALTYRSSALVTFGVGFIFLALMIPGIFETKKVTRSLPLTAGEPGPPGKAGRFFCHCPDCVLQQTLSWAR